jgi:DNA-binding GntR family transcriptional regulator
MGSIEILQAIRDRDPERARSSMPSHLRTRFVASGSNANPENRTG